jgi:hypothetical protein
MIIAELNVTAQIDIQVDLLDGLWGFLFLSAIPFEYYIFIVLLKCLLFLFLHELLTITDLFRAGGRIYLDID